MAEEVKKLKEEKKKAEAAKKPRAWGYNPLNKKPRHEDPEK